jgi:Ca-activated chloride channel family protein
MILAAITAFFATAPRLYAGTTVNVVKFVTPAEMRAGSLLLKGEGDRYVEAPLVATDADVVVSGPTARGRITQIFHNPTNGWVEGIYVYPLSEGSAVDTLKMVIGERIVVADIENRKEARELYEQAKAAGQKAALMEQERPNIFTNSVANIGPGETSSFRSSIRSRCISRAACSRCGCRWSWRRATTRSRWCRPSISAATASATWSIRCPIVNRIEPPVLDPRKHAPINPVSITLRLNAGFALGMVKSHHHSVAIEEVADNARVIKLADGPVPADRDFELTWTAASAVAPSVGLFRERVNDADYLLAFVTPPPVPQAEEKRPREVVFVIDNSGSMGGTSIMQAKASLIYALGRLKPADRFNVIRFDHTHDMLFGDSMPATSSNVLRAKTFVDALQARGGTEMVPPMRAALTDHNGKDEKTVRQVVFLTDGEVGNEQQLFDIISVMRGRSRIFMVGIGSAPNSFLMTRAAELGRGTFTHIGAVDQVEERMRSLFDKLESPAVTNLTATFSVGGADVTPIVLPDLYRGEPVALTARMAALSGTLEIKGLIGDRPWRVTLPLENAAQGSGLSKLWARRKITDAEVARTMRTITQEEADQRILTLALDHHLVSRLTSLIAVDKTPSRTEGARLSQAEIPLNLPAGWEFDKVFGPQGDAPSDPSFTPIERRADLTEAEKAQRVSYAAVAQSRGLQPQVQPATGATLPKTATDAEIRILFGILLCLVSLILLVVRRRHLVPAVRHGR